jgi:preprotein translocase subunit SecD
MSNHFRIKAACIALVLCASSLIGLYPFAADRWRLPLPSWLAAHRLNLGLDLQGGVHFVLGVGVPENATSAERETIVNETREVIERRVNELGVTEAVIATQGARGDQLLVQLPGVKDAEQAKRTLQSAGVLRLQIVERGPAASADALMAGAALPENSELVYGNDLPAGAGQAPGGPEARISEHVVYLVRRDLAVGGDQIRTARASVDENGQPSVNFTLREEGSRRFAELTGANVGRSLAVVLDGRVKSVAQIQERIAADGRIQGRFTSDETHELAILLRSGSLTVPLTYLAQQTIGASLGVDAIRAGMTASAAALLVVALFLAAFYRGAGVNAIAALLCNLIVLVALLAAVGVVLTLPGIAGIVLTIGIGVDSNVLIFERIKEELATGQGTGAAIDVAFRRVLGTLFDTHAAALVGAAFLFHMGPGTVRGFAVTLALGLMSNLFTSTFVSKTLFEMRRPGQPLSI